MCTKINFPSGVCGVLASTYVCEVQYSNSKRTIKKNNNNNQTPIKPLMLHNLLSMSSAAPVKIRKIPFYDGNKSITIIKNSWKKVFHQNDKSTLRWWHQLQFKVNVPSKTKRSTILWWYHADNRIPLKISVSSK